MVDEAHSTSGPWAAVHDDAVLPADRWLYPTATPRVADPRASEDDEEAEGGRALVASMVDERVFGPVVYRLTLTEDRDLKVLRDPPPRRRVVPSPSAR